MISNLVNKTNITAAGEVGAIGAGFATEYFDALAGRPDPSALRRFFSERSVYVCARRGRPDYQMHGLYLIGLFVKRMEYVRCTVAVRSVRTAARPGKPAELAVSSVCELTRPGNDVPLEFAQTFVVERVPWTRAEYRIVETKSTCDVEAEDEFLPRFVSQPIVARTAFTSKTVVDAPEEIVRAETVPVGKAAEKPPVTCASTDRDGKLGNPGNDSTTRRIQSDARNVSKPNNENATRVYVSRKKVAPNPMADIRSVKSSPKVVPKTSEKQTTERKTVTVEKQTVKNNVKSIEPKISARVDKKAFISTNRFAFLAVDDEYSDSSSIISDMPDNHSSSCDDAPDDINDRPEISLNMNTARRNKSRKCQAVNVSPKQKSNKPRTTAVDTPKCPRKKSGKCVGTGQQF